MRALINIQVSDQASSICFFKLLGFGSAYEYSEEEKSITVYLKLWKMCTYITFSIL